MSEQGTPHKARVRQILEELAAVSKDLEGNARMLAAAPNFIAAEQLKNRVNELTARQTEMMNGLVALHPDPKVRDKYQAMSREIDDLQKQVKLSTDVPKLRELEAQIGPKVESWVHLFQTIVSNLVGAPPPDAPVFQ